MHSCVSEPFSNCSNQSSQPGLLLLYHQKQPEKTRLRQLDKSHNPNVGSSYVLSVPLCTFMQVRFKKAGPKHADRILHVAFDAMCPMRPMHSGFLRTVVKILSLGRKRLEAILLQSIRTCTLHSRLLLFRSYRPQSDDNFSKNVTVRRLLAFENGPRPTAVSHVMQNDWIMVLFRHTQVE